MRSSWPIVAVACGTLLCFQQASAQQSVPVPAPGPASGLASPVAAAAVPDAAPQTIGSSGAPAPLTAAVLPPPPEPAPAAPVRASDRAVHVDADTLSMRGSREPAIGPEMVGEGHARIWSKALQLRAPRLEIYRSLHYEVLEGGVLGVDGLYAMMARRLTYESSTATLFADDATLVLKIGTTPEALVRALDTNDPHALLGCGRNGLTMKGESVRKDEAGNYDLRNDWVTTCVCAEGCTPLLSVSSVQGYIVPQHQAWLLFPVFRLFNVPVLPLPFASLPLKARETGLLFPVVNFTGPGGINFQVPVFITLGDSADVTLSALYFLGQLPNANVGGTGENSLGVRGPGADALLRWRPAVDSYGTLHILYLFDTSIGNTPHEYRGSRGEVLLNHSQGLLGGNAGVSVDLVSDSDVLADTSISYPRQAQSYTRSWAEYSRPAGPFNLSFDTNYIQDLSQYSSACPGGCLFRTPFGKLPAVFAPLAELTLSNTSRLNRMMFTQELVFDYEDAPHGQPLDGSPHMARLLGALSFSQTLPLLRGRFGNVSVETGERLQGKASPEGSGGGALRGGGYVGIIASSRIARTFETGWIHDIVPRLQIRGLDSWAQDANAFAFSPGLYPDRIGSSLNPGILGTLQNPLDLALPPQGTVQAVAALSTSVTPPHSAPVTLSVEEHAALYQTGPHPLDAGQLSATLIAPFGKNLVILRGGMDLKLGIPTQASAEYDRTFGFGVFKVGGSYLNGAANDQIARGLDLLFTPRAEIPTLATPPGVPAPPPSTDQAFVILNFQLGAFRIAFAGFLTYSPPQMTSAEVLVQDYAATVSYEAEGCGRIQLALHWTNVLGQPLQAPIPTPTYLFGDTRELGRAAQTATFPDF
jgi:hypothetical protein